jgi:type IV pilus assembly protein PilY1
VLYIINAATGNLIRSIDTKVGSSTAGSENGLSTPIALDVDNDRITDYIYAGDLKGNLWKFDVTHSNPSQWDVAYRSGSTPKPLYVACTSSSTPCASANLQPITAKPQVGKAGAGQTGGLMVYFGTGKYFESADTSTTQTQTFYGIWDKCDKTSSASCDGQVSGRDSLQQQAITQELAQGGFNLRVTSNCTVNYGSTPLSGAVSAPCTTTANRLGWYMDFIQPASSNLPANSDLGERVVSAPILCDGRIIFTTVIPSTDPCAFGGTGWLMELGSTSGQRLGSAQWDINGNDKIDSNGLVTSGGSSVAPSGKQSKVGIIKSPGIISAGTQEYKYTSGSTGNLEVTLEAAGISTGRKAWRQLR